MCCVFAKLGELFVKELGILIAFSRAFFASFSFSQVIAARKVCSVVFWCRMGKCGFVGVFFIGSGRGGRAYIPRNSSVLLGFGFGLLALLHFFLHFFPLPLSAQRKKIPKFA